MLEYFEIIYLQGFGNLAGIGKLLRFMVVLFRMVVLAQMEMESPEQKKQVFLVVKKRPTEALFTTIEILLFL